LLAEQSFIHSEKLATFFLSTTSEFTQNTISVFIVSAGTKSFTIYYQVGGRLDENDF
jgi:hypothetical protein